LRGQGHRPISFKLFSSMRTSTTSWPAIRSPRNRNWKSKAVLSRRTTTLGASHDRQASPSVIATPNPVGSREPGLRLLSDRTFTRQSSCWRGFDVDWVLLCLVTAEEQVNLHSPHCLLSSHENGDAELSRP